MYTASEYSRYYVYIYAKLAYISFNVYWLDHSDTIYNLQTIFLNIENILLRYYLIEIYFRVFEMCNPKSSYTFKKYTIVALFKNHTFSFIYVKTK